VDDYSGVKVHDPYRWLEDPESDESKAWIAGQNAITFDFLNQIEEKAAIEHKLESVWSYTRFGVPQVKGGRVFFTRKEGLQNQPVLYVSEGVGGTPRALLDPNRLSADGTIALKTFVPSSDGKLLAYQLSDGGSDWVEIRVRDVDSGKDLSDHVKHVKFSGISWSAPDQEHTPHGFFYSRYDVSDEEADLVGVNKFHKVYFHSIGTPQSEDRLAFERKDKPNWGFGSSVTDDGRYLVVHIWKGTSPKNDIWVQDLSAQGTSPFPLRAEFKASYGFIGSHGSDLYFRTDLDAPRGRVVRISLEEGKRAEMEEVIPEQEDAMESVHWVGDRFVGIYLQDARSSIRIFKNDGRFDRALKLPAPGTVWGINGKRTDRETFFGFSSYLHPPSVYHYDFDAEKLVVFRKPNLSIKPEQYETKQVFYKSKDGTKVPMFVTHLKGLRRNGLTPTYLYGYGGFNISITPYFSPAYIVWLQMGGVLAIPSLRGGAEYGEAWHEAGMREKKQNVFDDFIAAAEWLIEEGYTRASRLAIGGYSNGGLLVGACMAQRPELFGATLPGVGVMDMLRFHRFTIGWAWKSEYGDPDNPKDFPFIRAYSPLHNLKLGTTYPATMVTTADRDDRVVPAHSFKFISELQYAHRGIAPVLIRIETRAGHGAGKPTSKKIAEHADRLAFLLKTLNFDLPRDF
jgi:prolyl oligopeptidase